MPFSKQLTALLATTPDNLATQQKIAIKQHVVSILERVVFLLVKEAFGEIREMLCESPAGDCMGTEHHFLNLSWDDKHDDGLDIEEVITLLERLTTQENAAKEEGGIHRVINR